MIKMIVKKGTATIGEYVFNENILNSDTASQLVAYGAKVYPDDTVTFLRDAGIAPYTGEEVERTYTIMT